MARVGAWPLVEGAWYRMEQNPGRAKEQRVLQETFLAQESNWGLLHCRQILYQLSYQRCLL